MKQPTSSSERFPFLDILRGFALLGVIIANMASHSGFFFLSEEETEAFSTAKLDGVVTWLIHFLIDGKFYSLFSLLFGIGFALQMQRSTTSEISFTSRFSRRLLVLFFLGLLHAVFLYVGDILTVYALTGFVLLLFRNKSDKFIVRAAFILLLLPIIQYSIFWTQSLLSNTDISGNGRPPLFDSLILIYQTGDFADILLNNIGGLIFGRYPDLFFTGRFFRVLATFLIGFYICRNFNFNDLAAHKNYLRKVLIVAACIGFPCNFILAMLMETNAYYGLQPLGILEPTVYAFGVPSLALFYASGFALLYLTVSWRKIISIFAPVGQLALTNYLMQSVICCLIFMNYGLGLFAKVGPAILTVIAITIFTGQILFSHWWIRHFRFGPMEWLWRSLTYAKWQPIRKEIQYAPVSDPL